MMHQDLYSFKKHTQLALVEQASMSMMGPSIGMLEIVSLITVINAHNLRDGMMGLFTFLFQNENLFKIAKNIQSTSSLNT